jgi:hypothetical protein
MSLLIKHAKVSAIPDGTDTSLVLPSDWNNDHTFTGVLDIINGGTGQTTANAAVNALLPSQTSNAGKVLSTDGTDTSWIAASGSGTVTSVAATVPAFLSIAGSPITTTGTLAISLSGTALPAANGGTGATTLTANNVLLGNGTGALQVVAPSTSGNVLTSNGTTWTSAAAPSGGSAATPTVLGTVYARTTTNTVANTTVGYQAGAAIPTGTNNTLIGNIAGKLTSTGANNTAAGWAALELNTSGNLNVALGVETSNSNTTGISNTAVGSRSLNQNSTGSENTAVGSSVIYLATGSNNTAIGANAGFTGTNNITTGTNNILIGYNAEASLATVSNEITIGNSSSTKFRVPGISIDWDVNLVPFRNIPQNSQSAAYTLVASDSGKHIFHPSADTTARTYTIPANSSVAYPIGTAVTFINQNAAGVITIAITTDTMRLSPAGTTGSRTLAANGVATAIKITSTEWIISGSGLT